MKEKEEGLTSHNVTKLPDSHQTPEPSGAKIVLSTVPGSSGKLESDVSHSTPSTAIEMSSSESSNSKHTREAAAEIMDSPKNPESPANRYRYLVRPRSAEYCD